MDTRFPRVRAAASARFNLGFRVSASEQAAAYRIVYRLFPRVPNVGTRTLRRNNMGYLRRRGDRYYAVIHEGLDPVTGKEIRRWHPAGTDLAEAERPGATNVTCSSTSCPPSDKCRSGG